MSRVRTPSPAPPSLIHAQREIQPERLRVGRDDEPTIQTYSLKVRPATVIANASRPANARGAHTDRRAGCSRNGDCPQRDHRWRHRPADRHLQGRGVKPATVSTIERPLRTFLKWCVAREHIAKSPMDGRRPVTVPVEDVVFPTSLAPSGRGGWRPAVRPLRHRSPSAPTSPARGSRARRTSCRGRSRCPSSSPS
jgi:hypothetical protein